MGTQAEATTQNSEGKATETISDKVNTLVDKLVKDDKGSWTFPEGENVEETLAFAVMAERRRRDTQSEYTKVSQKTKALEAEKAKLLEKAMENAVGNLSPELQEELEELKFSDPEEWRKKVNKYEQEARTKRSQELDEELKQVSTSTLETTELERRKEVLQEFNDSHPDFSINDEVIQNDIPPRITKKLETGKITFEAFLQEVYDYAKKGKIVKQTEENPGMPNLTALTGGSRPESKALEKASANSYEKETY